jgi:hypothetical protein
MHPVVLTDYLIFILIFYIEAFVIIPIIPLTGKDIQHVVLDEKRLAVFTLKRGKLVLIINHNLKYNLTNNF